MDRDNKGTLGEGKLAVIDNQIDTTTATIKLKATFPNTDHRLWPGQFVNARLQLTTRKNGIVVPASVIQRGPDGTYAFVINPDMSVQIRPVKVAFIEGNDALIDSGLKQGESVVVDGQYKLQPGSKVKVGKAGKAAESDSGP
jgi:multidrug efflux system membrane fusion protein